MEAVWLYGLHCSCPASGLECHTVQDLHWRKVAETLLKRVLDLESSSAQMKSVRMLSHQYVIQDQCLQMPGSALVMQTLLEQMQDVQGLRDEDFVRVWFEQAEELTKVLRHCLSSLPSLWQSLEAVGHRTATGTAGLGLFGEDVITEIATRACVSASMQEWPGKPVFELVRGHLQMLVSSLVLHAFRKLGTDDEVDVCLRALFPAVAAVLLLPMSQSVASLQVKFSKLGTWSFDSSMLQWFEECGFVTWQMIQEYGVKAVLKRHAASLTESLEKSLCSAQNAEDLWLAASYFRSQYFWTYCDRL